MIASRFYHPPGAIKFALARPMLDKSECGPAGKGKHK